jgi:GntR family transcriptional regulator / MocR family aminotransferase
MRSTPRSRVVVSRSGRRTRWAPVAEALRRALASGSRAAGELLPSTRELASTFGVHRQTIMVALDALCAEGLLRAEPRRGYRVAAPEPGLPPPRPAKSRAAGYTFRIVREPGPIPAAIGAVKYPLHSATPDPSLLPLRELRASYAHVLARHGSSALDAATGAGNPLLVRELLDYLRRARAVLFERMLVTVGSQEGIALAARALLGPGDVVAVEDPGYLPAWQAFRAVGAEVVPVPVDARGLRVDALERLLRRRRVRLVYVTPNHQYPTTVTLSAPRRRALLELTLGHGVPILEDDYDHEYHYRGEPQAPLAASATAPHVLYVASLSKLVAPGVRIGMLCGSGELLDVLERHRQSTVRAGDGVTQAALADWIADGGFERHVRRARRAYAERRDAALAALSRAATKLPLELTPPDGGLAIWVRWPEHDTVELARRALARGVAVLPGPLASIEANSPGMRLAFGRVGPARFAEAVSILASEAKRM